MGVSPGRNGPPRHPGILPNTGRSRKPKMPDLPLFPAIFFAFGRRLRAEDTSPSGRAAAP